MTAATARTVAHLVLASAGVTAAYVIVTRPPLRRFVLLMSRAWLGASIPIFLANEVRRAWVQSAGAA